MKNKFVSYLKRIICFLKKRCLFMSIFLLSTTGLLYGVSMSTLPFDGQCEAEILSSINSSADSSKMGLSLNSITLSPTGNSDFWIYSDNELQDFQMRNQQNSDVRDYVFCVYEKDNHYSSFEYQGIKCTSILFESKFEQNNFYFDLPLLCGSFPRFYYKNQIFISDTFAKKIIAPDETLDSLIGKAIKAKSIGTKGSDEHEYIVMGVLDTNNNLGTFLKAAFGEDIVFLPEFNIFPIKASLFFCGSRNHDENKLLVEFVFSKYKERNNNARNLSIGYSIEYKFFDYSNEENTFSLGDTNIRLNSIIKGYKDYSLLVTIFGTIISISLFIYTTIIVKKYFNIKISASRKIQILCLWSLEAISLIIISLLYKYLPIISIIIRTRFLAYSHATSSVLFISWIFITILSSFLIVKRKQS